MEGGGQAQQHQDQEKGGTPQAQQGCGWPLVGLMLGCAGLAAGPTNTTAGRCQAHPASPGCATASPH